MSSCDNRVIDVNLLIHNKYYNTPTKELPLFVTYLYNQNPTLRHHEIKDFDKNFYIKSGYTGDSDYLPNFLTILVVLNEDFTIHKIETLARSYSVTDLKTQAKYMNLGEPLNYYYYYSTRVNYKDNLFLNEQSLSLIEEDMKKTFRRQFDTFICRKANTFVLMNRDSYVGGIDRQVHFIIQAIKEAIIIKGWNLEEMEKNNMTIKLKAAKDNPNHEVEHKAYNGTSVGYDVACCEDTTIPPMEWRVVPNGLTINIPEKGDYYVTVHLRSSMAFKKGLVCHQGIIDPGYTGELKIIVFNASSDNVTIKRGDKYAQLLAHKIADTGINLEQQINLDNTLKTARGSNGFGSSGK